MFCEILKLPLQLSIQLLLLHLPISVDNSPLQKAVLWHYTGEMSLQKLSAQSVVNVVQDELMSHCVTKWVFTAHMVIDLDELKRVYWKAWQSLPPGSLLTSSH